MKLLFENWRRFTLLSEEQLLAEGRLDDVKKKYPHLEVVIDYYAERDPSKDTPSPNKYLNWLAKQTEEIYRTNYNPEQYHPEAIIAAMMGSYIPNLANMVDKFHKHNQRMPNFGHSTDIQSYAHWNDLGDAVREVEQQETQATKRAEEKKAAQEGSEVIDDTDDYFIVRPFTHEASCYFGKKSHGTQAEWCITRREADYFNDYTSEGQMFYFVFLKQVDPTNRYKKLAFVLNADRDVDSAWDAPNSSLDGDEIAEAFVQNLLRQGENEGAWMTYLWGEGNRYADDPTEKDLVDYNAALKRLGIAAEVSESPKSSSLDSVTQQWDVSEKNKEIREMANETQSHILEQASDHAYGNPAGPTAEDYQKIQDAFEEEAEHASIYFDEYDAGKYYYNGGMSFEFHDLEWVDETADNDEVLEEIVREVADDHYVYPSNIEVYNEDIRLDFEPDPHNSRTSDLDGFQDFANEVLEYDGHWQEIYDGAISKLKGLRMIPSPDEDREREYWPSEEEKAKQIELPFKKGVEAASQSERDLAYIRSPQGAALRQRVGLQEKKQHSKSPLTKRKIRVRFKRTCS